jgi:hypothetical protein
MASRIPCDVDGGIVGRRCPHLAGDLVEHHDESPVGRRERRAEGGVDERGSPLEVLGGPYFPCLSLIVAIASRSVCSAVVAC